CEREAAAALDDLRDTIDLNDALLELAVLAVPVASAVSLFTRHQNARPPSRAPSARAATRPWYWYPPRSKTQVSIPASFARLASAWPTALACAIDSSERNSGSIKLPAPT